MLPQGDRELLKHPVAQELLQAKIPARIAYVASDGSPRAVPVWFHWDGRTVFIGTPTNAPKVKALRERPQVAITIDTNEFPNKVLLIRGTAHVSVEDEPFPEWLPTAQRYLGEDGGRKMLALVQRTFPNWARIAIRPEEVRILDFGASKFPSAWSAGGHR